VVTRLFPLQLHAPIILYAFHRCILWRSGTVNYYIFNWSHDLY
jgi:hypothetical protein